MVCMEAKATPTNDTNYSCHIKATELILTNHMWSISHHITPLVINSLRANTHTHRHPTETNLRNKACLIYSTIKLHTVTTSTKFNI